MAYAPDARRGPPSSAARRGVPPPRPHDNDRKRMLDVRREGHFKFDLREILVQGSLPAEQLASFTATVMSKGARGSTAEAKEYVTSKLQANVITKAERDAINTLLDRYSRWR